MNAQTQTDSQQAGRGVQESRNHRFDTTTADNILHELFGEVIYNYSRAQAIEDGVLVDLSTNYPSECRMYKFPVACTSAIWALVEQTVANKRHCNSVEGVIWDILYMSQRGVIARPDDRTVLFKVIITGTGRKNTHTFKAICGPGDDLAPVITIMLPEED